MLNVPSEVKNLFKLDSCHKNFRVHFPNGEMDDLTNDNVLQESVEFSESICSQDTFKFGLSESSTIEFETVGVGNMMGAHIECAMEIDCTSLGAAWAAEHPVDNTLPFLTPQTVSIGGGEAEENTYTGNPADFIGSSDDRITSLSIPINPTQSLNGYSKPWAGGSGKNKAKLTAVSAGVSLISDLTDNSVTVYNTTTSAGYKYKRFSALSAQPYAGQTLRFSAKASVAAGATTPRIVARLYEADGTTTVGSNLFELTGTTFSRSITLPATIADGVILCLNLYSDSGNGGANEISYSDIQLEVGSTATDFEPYSNVCPITGLSSLSVYVSPTQNQADATEYPLSFAEVLAGSIDPVLGAIKRRPVYSSYNGEPLVGPWLSSLDEYVSGATPTTGAQVVDLGGTETSESITPTAITLLLGQNYVWSSNGNVVTVKVVTGASRLYYRIPYGLFTVRECPRDHHAMAHRQVVAYTETKEFVTNYQKRLLEARGLNNKYTPKFMNMFCSVAGKNKESFLTGTGYTKALHIQLSSLNDEGGEYVYRFTGPSGDIYFKSEVKQKTLTIYSGDVSAYDLGYTQDAIYGLEGFENIKNGNLKNTIASVLVNDYGVPESEAYDDEYYDTGMETAGFEAKYATVGMPKSIGILGVKSLNSGGGFTEFINQRIDICNINGLYCINPDREDAVTIIGVLSKITFTPWSGPDAFPFSGHAIGDPIVAEAQGLDESYVNQYVAPSGTSFQLELDLEPTGSEYTTIGGITEKGIYTFSGAIDASKISTDYLEVNASFAAQNREGGIKTFNLDGTPVSIILPEHYSQFWWDESDISPIGSVRYTLYGKKDSDKEETMIYSFGDGQSVYDMKENTFFKEFSNSQSDIESILDDSFIPHVDVVKFTPIELEIGNGLPYLEAGDCIQAVSEDGLIARSFILSQTISGIQHLTQTIESSGGSLMNTTFSED